MVSGNGERWGVGMWMEPMEPVEARIQYGGTEEVPQTQWHVCVEMGGGR